MNISYASTFIRHLNSLPSNSIKFVFPYLYRCGAVIPMKLLILLLLVSWGWGAIDSSWDGFSETKVRRIHGPFKLVFMPLSVRGCTLFTQQDIGQLRKGLELHYNWCKSFIKIRWKLQLVWYSYDKKSANVVMWKDKKCEYISSAWNKHQEGAHHFSFAKCQPERMLNNRV